MREIKFRAWDKRNDKWFHPDLIIMTNAGFYEDYREFEDGNSLFDYEYEQMQYTGLKDKNGKEIYEGDIVKYLDGGYSYSENGRDEWEEMNIGEIVYDDENAMFDVTNKNCADREDVFEGGGDFEVIGNIYENPEILEKENELF